MLGAAPSAPLNRPGHSPDIVRKEYRYLVGSGLAQRSALTSRLHPPAQRDYVVRTLYLDTPSGTWSRGLSQTKYRLRRYNDESSLWYEIKRNVDGSVNKDRRLTTADEIDALALRPVFAVSYCRTEFVFPDDSAQDGLRATLDHRVTVYQVPVDLSPSQAMLTPGLAISQLTNPIFEVKLPAGESPIWLPLPQQWAGSKSRWGLAVLHGHGHMWAPSHRP